MGGDLALFTGLIRAGAVGWSFTLAAAAYNLIRLPKLLAAETTGQTI